jgi:hypothetical protein
MPNQCELFIGYLLPRRCEEKAVETCTNCGRGVCELHTRVGDQGLLCRDCYEQGRPLTPEEASSLPEPVQRVIYHRDDFSVFDTEAESDTFSTLS